jgi:hypothetical protein
MKTKYSLQALSFCILILTGCSGNQFEGTAIVTQYGYTNCIELKNDNVRVVLEPNMGGRIIVYELDGNNVLYHDPSQDGAVYNPEGRNVNPSGGRFDIGPEKIIPRRPSLFLGKWEGKIIGNREAQLISQSDTSTGVQLTRNFKLDKQSSKLTYTQVIKNVSNETKHYCAWSRTFAKGGGISLTPLNERSRFPKGFIVYGPEKNVMDYRPAPEPNVRVRNGILEIIGTPERPKYVMDVSDGWLGYITKDDQLFIKKFTVYPDRVYGEMTAANVSIWYYKDEKCEIEPIGPMETLKQGQEASFTEVWYLQDYKYPEDKLIDQIKLADIIKEL